MRISRFAIPLFIAFVLASCGEPTDPEDDRVILEPVSAQLTGEAGGLTESPPEVRAVRVSDGSPVAGVVVEFRLPLVPQIGAISRSLDTTDASGIASAGTWVLGRIAGIQTLHAFAFRYTTSTTVNARARAGPATSFSVSTQAVQYQLGGRQPVAPSVSARDSYGNGIEGMDVTFSPGQSGGSVGNLSTKTNATGVASAVTWTIPPAPGAYSVTATIATRTFDFTAHRVDSTSLVWYGLDSIAQGGKAVLPEQWNLKTVRLGLTPFDPCFCVNVNGMVFEIIDYTNGQHVEYSGSFRISGGKGGIYDTDEVKGSGTSVVVVRYDYYSIHLISYFYSRRT